MTWFRHFCSGTKIKSQALTGVFNPFKCEIKHLSLDRQTCICYPSNTCDRKYYTARKEICALLLWVGISLLDCCSSITACSMISLSFRTKPRGSPAALIFFNLKLKHPPHTFNLGHNHWRYNGSETLHLFWKEMPGKPKEAKKTVASRFSVRKQNRRPNGHRVVTLRSSGLGMPHGQHMWQEDGSRVYSLCDSELLFMHSTDKGEKHLSLRYTDEFTIQAHLMHYGFTLILKMVITAHKVS